MSQRFSVDALNTWARAAIKFSIHGGTLLEFVEATIECGAGAKPPPAKERGSALSDVNLLSRLQTGRKVAMNAVRILRCDVTPIQGPTKYGREAREAIECKLACDKADDQNPRYTDDLFRFATEILLPEAKKTSSHEQDALKASDIKTRLAVIRKNYVVLNMRTG
jgi:hypothetical protein